MNEPTFSLINKSKLIKGESNNSGHSHIEGFERSKSNSKNNQTIYLIVYLALEKNVRVLTQSCKKIVYKTNRNAFRQILQFTRNDKIQKNASNYFASTQKLKTQSGKAKAIQEQQNPEKKLRSIQNLSFKKTVLTLKNLINIAQKMTKNALMMSWVRMQCIGMQIVNQDYNNQVPFVSQEIIQESESITKNVSRLSNKRKVTKGRQEYKENSHLSTTELIAENQKLKNELMNEEYERQAFVQQLGELLQKHEKSLAQGYSTTRTHKKNK